MPLKRSRAQQLSYVQTLLRRRDVAIEKLVTSLAVLLVGSGLTPKQLQMTTQLTFARFAASLSRLQNGRYNYSRVAVITGLARSRVRRLLTTNIAGGIVLARSSGPLEKIITAWL